MMVLGVHSTLGEKTNVLRFMLNEEVSMLMMGDMWSVDSQVPLRIDK